LQNARGIFPMNATLQRLGMNFLKFSSIRKKLSFLVMCAVLPALVILLCSGIEQRRQSIENAKQDVLRLTNNMAKAQKQITRSARQALATLSLLPAIQAMDLQTSTEILMGILEQNPNYNNITLTGLNGDVLAAGKTFTRVNLADRKHFREAIERKNFAVGEFIMSRVGLVAPALACAYPVLDKNDKLKAVLTVAIKLTSFADFYDVSTLPEKSFIAVTDHQGIRLFYYPAQEKTNPVGAPINVKNLEISSKALEPGMFIGTGSDGMRRIFAFEQVPLDHGDTPYLYVWAGIPETYILAPANAALTRNLLFMLLASVISLFVSWSIGRNTLISPIQNLVILTQKFAKGDLEARSELSANLDEFGTLANAFYNMADTLSKDQLVKNDLIEKLEKSITEIHTLQGILPICSFCKNIRNDEGYYEQIEGYIHKHSGVDFSHTICPTCAKEHYPKEYASIMEKNGE
jgi:HAMP domain-containing protein